MKGYEKETKWKFYQMMLSWQDQITEKRWDLFHKICDNIERNPKYKLPWMMMEVIAAVESVKTLFELKC